MPRVAVAPPASANPAVQYLVIGGTVVAIALLIYFISTAMGSSTCGECKGKGFLICENCKNGTPKCTACKGTGNDPQTFSTCMKCQGKGSSTTCEKCKGEPKRRCPSCGGTGSKS